MKVAPHTGAWIEIKTTGKYRNKVTSLPTRERELKCKIKDNRDFLEVSLPTRERELKLIFKVFLYILIKSLPTRERELKS